jgi:hypothetical protein
MVMKINFSRSKIDRLMQINSKIVHNKRTLLLYIYRYASIFKPIYAYIEIGIEFGVYHLLDVQILPGQQRATRLQVFGFQVFLVGIRWHF